MTSHSQTSDYFNWEKLNKLSELVSYRPEDFLDSLDIEYTNIGKFFVGPCPVHEGDNATAFNFYPDGNMGCNWTCWTHGCHNKKGQGGFGEHIFGLVRGVKKLTWHQSVDYVCDFLKVSLDNIEIKQEDLNKQKTKKQINILQSTRTQNTSTITKNMVRSSLDIPATYYIDRGFSPQILDKYDVGLCTNMMKPMYNRIVIPVYDDTYSFVQGVTCRSIFEKHSDCGMYHNLSQKCPSSDEFVKYAKWRNNDGFNKSSYLYNYWFAKEYIKKTGVAVLVEGPGDVWKMEEAGIHNSLAIFGTKLTDQQLIILEQSGAMTIIVMTDMDIPGRESAKTINGQLERLFSVKVPKYDSADVGSMTIESINKLFEENKWRK
jgi:DNA primase